MAGLEHTPNEERLQTKQSSEEAAQPESERGGRLGWASALGNSAVQRILRSGDGGAGTVDESVEQDIKAQRGGGSRLDSGAAGELGGQLGDDYSDVRVHTGPQADSLNKSVRADAFTTGSDIFFREGKYDPGSSDGKKLLAHELTHVTQQRGQAGGSGPMTVSDPADESEQHASSVADKVSSGDGGGVSRQAAEPLARQGDNEDDDSDTATEPATPREEEQDELATSLARMEEEKKTSPATPGAQAFGQGGGLSFGGGASQGGGAIGHEASHTMQQGPGAKEEERLAQSPAADLERAGEEEELAMSPAADLERQDEEEEVAMQATEEQEEEEMAQE